MTIYSYPNPNVYPFPYYSIHILFFELILNNIQYIQVNSFS